MTPYQVVTEKVPDVNFFHPFGCQAFAFHHDDSEPKFGTKGRECIFLGYDSVRKAYRLLCITNSAIIIRAPRDVTFVDHVFPMRDSRFIEAMKKLSTISSTNDDADEDYLDFELPNPPSSISGGAQAHQVPASPLHIPTNQPSSQSPGTPPLVIPSSPHQIVGGNDNCQSDASSTPLHIRIQNDPGDVSTFLKSIPPNLGRTRSQSIKLIEEIAITEDFIHHKDHEAFIFLSETNRIDIITPKSFQQAISLPESDQWKVAMDKDMDAIITAKTYVLVPSNTVPPYARVETPIWSFRVKFDGTFKARLCFPGHKQQYGIDYFQTESPVCKFSTFRTFVVIATQKAEKIYHFDIPSAFLNGDISEEVYMKQPIGYIDSKFPDHVCFLLKALYGLRQASLAWYIKLDNVLTALGLFKHHADPCLYYLFQKDGNWVLVLIYVDDNAIAGTPKLRQIVIEALIKEFRAKDLGLASRYIGTSIEYFPDGLLLHQKKDIEELLQKFKFFNITQLRTPFDKTATHRSISESDVFDQSKYRSAIGSLMWYALSTRPDILFAVTALAQFQAAPTKTAWELITRIFRYLKGTLNYGIFIPFPKGDQPQTFTLQAYSDASWAIPIMENRSASGCIFFLNGVPIHWVCRKQRLATLSSTESEIVASSLCGQELLWLLQLVDKIVILTKPIELCIDNMSMKYILESILTSHRTKHLDIRYLFVRQLIQEFPVILKWVASYENLADIFTKYLDAASSFKSLACRILREREH